MWQIVEIIQMIKDMANKWRAMVSTQNSNTQEYRSIWIKFDHIPSEEEVIVEAQRIVDGLNIIPQSEPE